MSADNGFIIRKNKDNKFALQEYSASSESYPAINHPNVMLFDTLTEAVLKYEGLDTEDNLIEYGLTVNIAQVTMPTYRS